MHRPKLGVLRPLLVAVTALSLLGHVNSVRGAGFLTASKIGPATVAPGDTITWTVTITQNSGSTREVDFSDTIPAGVLVTSVTITTGVPADCFGAGTITPGCSFFLASGATKTATITAKVTGSAGSTLVNSGNVTLILNPNPN